MMASKIWNDDEPCLLNVLDFFRESLSERMS